MIMTTKKQTAFSIMVGAIFWGVLADRGDAQQVRSYQVNYTNNAPSINGSIAPGEWDDAVAFEGDFSLLRLPAGTESTELVAWRAMWDDEALYLLVTSNYGNWSPSIGGFGGGIDFNADNLNFYIDPNTDDEENLTAPDGYQIAFNQRQGLSSFDEGLASGTGFFLEAHLNTGFGNQGNWGGLSEATTMFQINGPEGGVMEMKLAFSDINAEPTGENGIYHPGAPENGDTWFFNIGRISTNPNNFLPIWQWNSSNSFVTRPDGEITFEGKTVPPSGDLDGDGDVDRGDVTFLAENLGLELSLLDAATVQAQFGTAAPSASAVPEPSGAILLLLGATSMIACRRRRR